MWWNFLIIDKLGEILCSSQEEATKLMCLILFKRFLWRKNNLLDWRDKTKSAKVWNDYILVWTHLRTTHTSISFLWLCLIKSIIVYLYVSFPVALGKQDIWFVLSVWSCSIDVFFFNVICIANIYVRVCFVLFFLKYCYLYLYLLLAKLFKSFAVLCIPHYLKHISTSKYRSLKLFRTYIINLYIRYICYFLSYIFVV